MNKPDVQNATNGSGANNRAPAYSKFDPKPAVEQVVHEVTADDVIKAPVPPTPAKSAANNLPRAGRGDDDVMSQQTRH